MPFHFCHAGASLAGTVRAFWAFSEAPGAGTRDDERIVPDGCTELIVHFGDRFDERSGAQFVRQPAAIFAGQLDSPLWLRPGAHVDVFGVRFEPGGARRLGLPPQWQLAGQRIAFEDLLAARWRAPWRETLECMATCTGFAPRVAEMQVLLARLAAPGAGNAIDAAVEAITQAGGVLDLAGVAEHAGLSSRQMQRRFLAEVGMTPKLFARIVRFQRVFSRWHNQPGAWSGVALDCGYFDQSHLLRDFRQFAGSAPVAFFQSPQAGEGYLGPALLPGEPT